MNVVSFPMFRQTYRTHIVTWQFWLIYDMNPWTHIRSQHIYIYIQTYRTHIRSQHIIYHMDRLMLICWLLRLVLHQTGAGSSESTSRGCWRYLTMRDLTGRNMLWGDVSEKTEGSVYLPSGKQPHNYHNYGKIHRFIAGKITTISMVIFNSKL